MGSELQGRPRLTPKGERTRARIVEAAARLIYERGVAGTPLDDVKTAAEVSGSQMYQYFPDTDELVQAVITHQAGVIAGSQPQADLGSTGGLQAWRDMVISQARTSEGKGGCPLGSLAGQLAETDPRARALLASGFGQWQAAIGDGLRRLHDAGHLPDGTDPDALAVTLLATLQGGLLLAQVQRTPARWRRRSGHSSDSPGPAAPKRRKIPGPPGYRPLRGTEPGTSWHEDVDRPVPAASRPGTPITKCRRQALAAHMARLAWRQAHWAATWTRTPHAQP